MTLSPSLRKLFLTVHIATSVSWLGAVATFLVLAVAGLLGEDDARIRAAYLAMEVITWWVIVPLSAATLISGVFQSLGTPWGLLRHCWVLIKLLLTVFASLLLLLHTRPIGLVARAAQDVAVSLELYRQPRLQLVVDAAAAVLLLLVTTVLSVYKPRGLTTYGRRKQQVAASL